MLFHAQNGNIKIGDADMDYVVFGKGEQVLILLPGLSDGLTTVKGMALSLAFAYRIYAADHRVYVFSRKNKLDKGYSTRQMAQDQADAMKALGISQADIMGVSQGGMIAQYIAIDHPELVRRLILAVTTSGQSETTQAVINAWIRMAMDGDYKRLIIDTTERSYSERTLKKYRRLYPLLTKIGRPKDFERFLIQADSCLQHNAYSELGRITCPTLVIGGDSDKIVGADAAGKLAGAIDGSVLHIYEGLGHAAYEEAKDFNSRVLDFLRRTFTVLTVAGVLLLCGCSDQKQPSQEPEIIQEPQSEETVENEQPEEETTADEPLEEADSDTAANEAAGCSAPTIVITAEKKEFYTDDGEQLLLEASADRVEAIGDEFDALNTALSEKWSGLGDSYEESLEMAREDYDYLENKDHFMSYYVTDSVAAYRIDNCVVSFCDMYGGYSGGAHDYYGFDGATFDVKSGRELALEDILSDAEGFYNKAINYILEELEENYSEGLFSWYQDVVRSDTFGETPMCWYLDNTGIVIEYGLYTVAPYVTGAPEVTLPYDEFAEYIKEEYRKPCSSVIARVEENEDFSRLIGENGEVMLVSEYDEEYAGSEVTVVSGNASETVGTFARFMSSYVIKRENGRSFLVFYCDEASDDFVTYVYEVTGGNVRKCDSLGGASLSGSRYGAVTCFYIGTDKIGLSVHLDVLGTYTGDMVYLLSDDGELTQTGEIFAIDTSYELTVIRELPVTLEGEKTTLPAGSKIKITGTDNAGTAYFRRDTGETGSIQYVRDDEQWQLLIDGVSENEYFEMVPYAG